MQQIRLPTAIKRKEKKKKQEMFYSDGTNQAHTS